MAEEIKPNAEESKPQLSVKTEEQLPKQTAEVKQIVVNAGEEDPFKKSNEFLDFLHNYKAEPILV